MKDDAVKNIVLLKQSFPIYNHENSLIREKDSQHYVKLLVAELEINEIAYFILANCNGENSVESILKKIENEYEISGQDIKSDTLVFLHDAWRKGLITWKGQSPFRAIYMKEYTGNIVFKRILATDIISIISKIKDRAIVSSKINIDAWYQPEHIYRLEEIGGEYYFQIEKDNELKGVIAISPDIVFEKECFKTISLQLNFVYIDIDNKLIVDDFFKWVVGFLYYVDELEVEQYKNYVNMELKRNPTDEKLLFNYGFQKITYDECSTVEYYEKAIV